MTVLGWVVFIIFGFPLVVLGFVAGLIFHALDIGFQFGKNAW